MDYINELNEKQYEAVSASERFLRIIAGAGSGKTRVLTYRIAYLIEKFHVLPNSILAITFTNKVAKEMNQRTYALLPGYDLHGLTISTFHSWCARFLRSEINLLGFPRNYIIYDDDDQMRIIKDIGTKLGYKTGDAKNSEAKSYISFNKSSGKLPSDIDQNAVYFDRVLFKYFVEYEKVKNEAKALDFDDLLIYALKILENFPEVRERYSNKYHDILIDEFQDTNDLQFKLLSNLVGPNTNLYVVGDPDQTIYTWRGANQRIILDFDKVYHPLKTIILNQNYRSTNEILNVANKLIANNKDRLKKDLFTNKSGDKVSIKNFDTGILEAQFVCASIKEIMKNDPSVSYKDFAILYRSSYLSLKFENALAMNQIPYNVFGGLKFYSRKEIKDCLAYFKLFVTSKDNVSFDRIINVPRRGIGDKTIEVLKEESEQYGLSLYDYANSIYEYKTQLKESMKVKLTSLCDVINKYKKKLSDNTEAYSEILSDFLSEIGYYDYLEETEEDTDALENVNALIGDVRNFLKNNQDSTFDEYLQNVTLLTSQDDMDNSDKVSLMTVHTAKGLEFNYVFVIGFNEGVFPNSRALNERNSKGLEEERRLAYVAFTRAKKKLFVTLNREYNYTTKCDNQPSSFIKEAGIELPVYSFSFRGAANQDNGRRLYKYDIDKYSTGSGIARKQSSHDSNSNFLNVNPGNNITWHEGDKAIHKTFGEGIVKHVDGDIVTIDFLDFGTKRLLGSHKALSKKG